MANKPLQQSVVPQGHRVESRRRLGGTPAAERQGVIFIIDWNYVTLNFTFNRFASMHIMSPRYFHAITFCCDAG